MRRRLPLLAIAVLVLSFASVAFAKHAVTSELSMKLNKSGSALKGKLTSTKASCVKGGIEVAVYYQSTPGTGYENVISVHTNTDGTYKVPAPGDTIPPGKYYGKTAGSGKCPGTKSNKVTVADTP